MFYFKQQQEQRTSPLPQCCILLQTVPAGKPCTLLQSVCSTFPILRDTNGVRNFKI